MDSRCCETIDCNVPLNQVLGERAAVAINKYYFTPFEFISREEWIGSRVWIYYINILRKMRVVFVRQRVKPVERFSSFSFPVLTGPMTLLMVVLSLAYTGLFVAGWNFNFPTGTEKLFWRLASLGTLIITIVCGMFQIVCIFVDPWKMSWTRQTPRPDLELAEVTPTRAPPLEKEKK